MNLLQKSYISRISCFLIVLVCTPLLLPTLCAQEKEVPQYTVEEYKAYQDITAENDAAKKTGLVVKFMQDYPKSTLQQHVMAAYQGMMTDLQKSQRWSQIVSCGEQFLKVAPADAFTFSMLATGYQRTNNLKQFVIFGERAFEKKADGNLAYYMAKAYKDLKDDAHYIQWAEKALTLLPDNYELLLDLAKSMAISNRQAQAAKYARQGIKVLSSAPKPEGTDDKVWKEYTNNGLANCYAIVGNVAYEQKDYSSAIANLENSVKYYKRNGLAYYYMGLSYWQQNKVDMAMLDLAKAYLLGGPSAAAAKQHLDNLYRSTHQQRLVGQERVINKAKEELK
jgi:tetratricopeptide (TPR) repeat protein